MVKHQVKNPVVKSFWEKRNSQNSGQREKRRIWFRILLSKFGPLWPMQIRNILGTEWNRGFDFEMSWITKILLVESFKGKRRNLNSKLLGMIMVSKIQMAAMSRGYLQKRTKRLFTSMWWSFKISIWVPSLLFCRKLENIDWICCCASVYFARLHKQWERKENTKTPFVMRCLEMGEFYDVSENWYTMPETMEKVSAMFSPTRSY